MRPLVTEGAERPASALRPERPAPAPAVPVISTRELMRGERRLLIEHDGEIYVLQVTRQNKLLLTK